MTRAVVILALAAMALAACGKRGELQRPGPMWDNPAQTAPSKAATAK